MIGTASSAIARRNLLYAVLLAATIIAYYGGVIALWSWSNEATFARFEFAQGIYPVQFKDIEHPYAHRPIPFVDLATVMSWRECHLLGYDVEVSNPCDLRKGRGNLAIYSPLVPRLPIEWIGIHNIVAAALALDGAFLVLLFYILRPKTWPECAVAMVGVVSPVTFFALERANLDLLIFLIVVGAMLLPQRRRWARLLFYAAACMGFLLKFYPAALLIAMLRERLGLVLQLAALVLVGLIAYVTYFWSDLIRIPALMPANFTFSAMFGGPILAKGLLEGLALSPTIYVIIYPLCCAASLGIALIVARKVEEASPGPDILDRKMGLLLCGSIIIVACFYEGFSVYYRAIFLLPTLPGLYALRSNLTGLRKLLTLGLGATLFCLYADMFRATGMHFLSNALGMGSAGLLIFLFREFIWWFEVTLLCGILIALLRRSVAVAELLSLLVPPHKRIAAGI